MSNVCYLAVILIFFVITTRYLMVTTSYCSLLVVTARQLSLLLVPTSSMNEILEVNANRVTGFVFIANILLAALKDEIPLESASENDSLASKHCTAWTLYLMLFGNCNFYLSHNFQVFQP